MASLETPIFDHINYLFDRWINCMVYIIKDDNGDLWREDPLYWPNLTHNLDFDDEILEMLSSILEEGKLGDEGDGSCHGKLQKEIDSNLFNIDLNSNGVLYLNKLARFSTKIQLYFSFWLIEDFDKIITTLDPSSEVGFSLFDNYNDDNTRSFPSGPYQNLASHFNPIKRGFELINETIRTTITQSLYYKEHPDLIHLAPNSNEVLDGDKSGYSKSQLKNLPQKILLLYKLGFFKLDEVRALSNEARGRLVSELCGGNADNAVVYIRNCDPQRTTLEDNPYKNPKNVKAVNDVIRTLNKDR